MNKEQGGWKSIKDFPPPEDKPILTRIDDIIGIRNEAILTRKRNLWFTGGIYVYYTPTHWKSTQEGGSK